LDQLASSIDGYGTRVGGSERRAFFLTNSLFEGGADSATGRTRSLFSRSLIVTDADLVPEDKGLNGEISLNLRGRDLRYATLDRTDLHGADLTGAKLTYASLKGTRLEDAVLVRADLRMAEFWSPGSDDTEFVAARLARANFQRAQMHGVNLHGVLAHGANFSKAELPGAVFLDARLQGADFQHANLVAANFTGATLDGARLSSAKIFGANFAKSRLVAADMFNVALIGNDFRGADLSGADMRSGPIWLSTLPSETDKLDLRFRVLIPPSPATLAFVEATVAAFLDDDFRLKMSSKLAHLLKAKDLSSWGEHREHAEWATLIADTSQWDAKRLNQLNRFLSATACTDLTPHAAVANGIARRGGATFLFQPSFNGNVDWLFRALKSGECRPALGSVRPTLLEALRRAARLQEAAASSSDESSVNDLANPPGTAPGAFEKPHKTQSGAGDPATETDATQQNEKNKTSPPTDNSPAGGE
ncbi:MAG: pentapeptide repeat-containing protein, partial [Pseudomonadota bacterium]